MGNLEIFSRWSLKAYDNISQSVNNKKSANDGIIHTHCLGEGLCLGRSFSPLGDKVCIHWIW